MGKRGGVVWKTEFRYPGTKAGAGLFEVDYPLPSDKVYGTITPAAAAAAAGLFYWNHSGVIDRYGVCNAYGYTKVSNPDFFNDFQLEIRRPVPTAKKKPREIQRGLR